MRRESSLKFPVGFIYFGGKTLRKLRIASWISSSSSVSTTLIPVNEYSKKTDRYIYIEIDIDSFPYLGEYMSLCSLPESWIEKIRPGRTRKRQYQIEKHFQLSTKKKNPMGKFSFLGKKKKKRIKTAFLPCNCPVLLSGLRKRLEHALEREALRREIYVDRLFC